MGFFFNYVCDKSELSKFDEKYLLWILNKRRVSPGNLILNLKAPSSQILQTAYILGDKSEKEIVVFHTPKRLMRHITNNDYIMALVDNNFENYKKLNFSYLRNKQSELFNAKLLLKYKSGLEDAIRRYKPIRNLSLQTQDIYDMYTAEHDLMLEEFEYAELVLSKPREEQKKINYVPLREVANIIQNEAAKE